jgi:TonB family protein
MKKVEAEIAEAREHGKRVALEYIAEARARGELPEQAAEEPEGPGQVVAPTPGSLEAVVEGGLARELIRRVVRAHIGDVRDCYNAGLAKDAALAGRIAVRFTITAEGQVADVGVAERSLADAAVERCIGGAVARWIFPRPDDGAPVAVTYPFELSPG